MWLILPLLRRIELRFFSVGGYKKARRIGKQSKLNSDLRLADRIVAHYRLPQGMFQEDNMRAKLVEGLTAFATRRGFLQTAASACGAFGLALLGADVASGVSAYCCGLCLSPSTCTSCLYVELDVCVQRRWLHVLLHGITSGEGSGAAGTATAHGGTLAQPHRILSVLADG